MGGDEEGGFARKSASALNSNASSRRSAPQKVGIHLSAVDDAEDLAFDNIEHFLPDMTLDQTEAGPAIDGGGCRNMGGGGGEPYFEQLFGTLEGGGGGV